MPFSVKGSTRLNPYLPCLSTSWAPSAFLDINIRRPLHPPNAFIEVEINAEQRSFGRGDCRRAVVVRNACGTIVITILELATYGTSVSSAAVIIIRASGAAGS